MNGCVKGAAAVKVRGDCVYISPCFDLMCKIKEKMREIMVVDASYGPRWLIMTNSLGLQYLEQWIFSHMMVIFLVPGGCG